MAGPDDQNDDGDEGEGSALDRGAEKAGQAVGAYFGGSVGSKIGGKIAKSGGGKMLLIAALGGVIAPFVILFAVVVVLLGSGAASPASACTSASSAVDVSTGGTITLPGVGTGQKANVTLPDGSSITVIKQADGNMVQDIGPNDPNWLSEINHTYPTTYTGQPGIELPSYVIAALAQAAGQTVGASIPGETMYQVDEGEGSQHPGIVQSTPTEHDRGFGLWQITDLSGADPDPTTATRTPLISQYGWHFEPDMLNPIKNAIAMGLLYQGSGIGAWYGTSNVTNWHANYSGSLPLGNLYTALGISGPSGGGSTSGGTTEDVSSSSSCCPSGGSSSGSSCACPSSSTGAGTIDTASANTYIGNLPKATKVAYAVVTSNGQVLAQSSNAATFTDYGSSITKAMLLVAYLRAHANAPPTGNANTYLSGMVEDSDNGTGQAPSLSDLQDTAASFAWRGIGSTDKARDAALMSLASAAGMSSFSIPSDAADNTYMLAKAKVNALDFAKFFANIDQLIPPAVSSYGMSLLANINKADSWGILNAGITGITASKAGWGIPDGSGGTVVNQAAQVQTGNGTVGIAILSIGSKSTTPGQTVMQTVSRDLLATFASSANPTASCTLSGSVPTVSGDTAVLLPGGVAAPPANAPIAVQNVIEAADQIINYPYCWGGGHGGFAASAGDNSQCNGGAEGFDCSGAVSYALNGGGLMPGGPMASEGFETWGEPGLGKWITVFSNSGHVYMEVAGLWFNTENGILGAAPQPASQGATGTDTTQGGFNSGPRWASSQSATFSGVDKYPRSDGDGPFIATHPSGL